MIAKIKCWCHDVKCGKWKKNIIAGLVLLTHACNPSYSASRVLITLGFDDIPGKEIRKHYLKNTQQTHKKRRTTTKVLNIKKGLAEYQNGSAPT
jgi:hypothetical protein